MSADRPELFCWEERRTESLDVFRTARVCRTDLIAMASICKKPGDSESDAHLAAQFHLLDHHFNLSVYRKRIPQTISFLEELLASDCVVNFGFWIHSHVASGVH